MLLCLSVCVCVCVCVCMCVCVYMFVCMCGHVNIHDDAGNGSLQIDIFDAAERYLSEKRDLILLTGKEYGSGSSRDWAAKGPYMLVRGEAFLSWVVGCMR